MPASTAVTLGFVELITACFLAAVILGEPVTMTKVTGVVMLIIGMRIVANELKASS